MRDELPLGSIVMVVYLGMVIVVTGSFWTFCLQGRGLL